MNSVSSAAAAERLRVARQAKTESCVASKLAASSTQELLTPAHALSNWVVHEAIPSSVVESPTFQAFVHRLCCRLATRWVLSSCALILVYPAAAVKAEVASRLAALPFVAITVDSWSQVDIQSDTANMADVFFGATVAEMHYEQQAGGAMPSRLASGYGVGAAAARLGCKMQNTDWVALHDHGLLLSPTSGGDGTGHVRITSRQSVFRLFVYSLVFSSSRLHSPGGERGGEARGRVAVGR
ncbi:hypothetical protein HaLaN_05940 [Haematococcus lacustris]|uniref:Uncharacterized protein n=1 Tax=Haematococcus lacustris TaxID=44745 RepID=A0A699YVT4_HAELA|nr:hypothetical protein HaLaN_05940 [Haematococcus lacustris]